MTLTNDSWTWHMSLIPSRGSGPESWKIPSNFHDTDPWTWPTACGPSHGLGPESWKFYLIYTTLTHDSWTKLWKPNSERFFWVNLRAFWLFSLWGSALICLKPFWTINDDYFQKKYNLKPVLLPSLPLPPKYSKRKKHLGVKVQGSYSSCLKFCSSKRHVETLFILSITRFCQFTW